MASAQTPKLGAASAGTTPVSADLTPGSLVFAKMKSFPPWPAKVVAVDEFPGSVPRHHVPVLFLGSGDYGHVASKDCFPYLEYRNQFGTPKQRPKFAEAIREADELCNQQQSRKRQSSKALETDKSASSSPAKKPRGRQLRGKKAQVEETSGDTAHEEEAMATTEPLLPASQLAEIAASTVFEPEPEMHDASSKRQPSPLRAGDTDDTDEDDAISNVVRQLEELEKQEASERQFYQADTVSKTDSLAESGSSTAPKRPRGRPPKNRLNSETSASPMTSPKVSDETESVKPSYTRFLHKRSMSENTDDGHGGNAGIGSQSSGSETPLSGGDSGQLGKRRHKPKIMSEYFLEYDYASPRAHKKAESGSAGTAATGSSQPHASKVPQQKSVKSSRAEQRPTKVSASRGRKPGLSGSGAKSTKELEKAALEAEIERVKMAAEETDQQQVASDSQLWQRDEPFSDLPFDDSMFEAATYEVTVDVEESPGGGSVGQYGTETAGPLSQAAAKRRKDAIEIAREKEKSRQKEKPKLKVKLLKDLLPAPKTLGAAPAATGGRKGKDKAISSMSYTKKKSMGAGKMKVKIAKKRATKAAKVVAAAEMKVKKKRGRKPLIAKKLKPEKRITGYSLWAEREMPILRQQHPDVKGMKNIRELLQARYKQLSETERKTWKIMAKREKEKLVRERDGTTQKVKGASRTPSSPGVSSVRPGSTASPRGLTPSSPRVSKAFGMSPSHALSPSVEMGQQLHQLYDEGGALVGAQGGPYYQAGASGVSALTYGGSDVGHQSFVSSYGGQVQTPVATTTPIKRPRGRPPKHPRPPEQQQQQKLASQSQQLTQSMQQQDAQAAGSLLGYQAMAPLPKGLKIPKREANQQQMKPPLKILTVGQRRPPFQARSPQPIMHAQGHSLMSPALEEPPVPEAMSHEELVYDSETAAVAAAAAAAMGMENAGIMADGVSEEIAYGQMEHHHQHEELGEETAAAVSYLTGDQAPQSQQRGIMKSKAQLDEERAARKRESRRRSRAKQKALKEQKKMEETGQQPMSSQVRHQKRDLMAAIQYGKEQGAYVDQAVVADSPAAYEVAYVEPRPTEEETNMFFFGTPQDVQSLLEVRNTPASMEGMCRWWLADEIDPELQGGKGKGGRGQSPPRALTAEPLDAAAVFKLIGRSFETVGNQLLREENEDSPHEIAAGMDMLLDSLVSSVTHLLTLTGAVPPFDQRYNRDTFSRLVEETAMMIPL